MKTFEVVKSARTYVCEEATPEQLIEMCEKLKGGKLKQVHRDKLRKNIEIYRDNPNNIEVKNKVISVILDNVTRRQLLNDCNMLTHFIYGNDTIICNILETRRNPSSVYRSIRVNDIL